jgi:hypothetical protein
MAEPRLKRSVAWKHSEPGQYESHDQMHAVRKVTNRKWQRGIRQPYNLDGQYDFASGGTFSRLNEAQAHAEGEEAVQPRAHKMRTQYHDRRGL